MLKLGQLDYVSSRSREACEKRHIHKLVTVPFSIFSCFVSLDASEDWEAGFCSFPHGLIVATPSMLSTVIPESRNIASK